MAWIACAAAALAAAAFAPNTYWLFVLGMAGITCIAAAGLNVLTGLTGQVSLGHAGFFAIGAYVNAILTTKAGVGFWWTLPAAALASGAIGFVLAAPALRVRGPYLAMVTIAFGIIIENAIAEWEPVTGGFNGIQDVPRPALFGFAFGMRSHVVLIVLFAIAAVAAFARLAASRAGIAMRATRDSEIAAAAIGINPLWPRASAFAGAAAAAGIAGALYAPLAGFVSPESFSFYQSILFLLVVILGGVGTVAGPVAGAAVMTALPEMLSGFAEYRLLFFGALLLALLWLAPEGIVGAWNRRFGARRRDPVGGDAARAEVFLRSGARPEPLIVRGLGIDFGGGVGVAGAGFEAQAGQVHAVIGPNGAGKTTLLNLIGGFYRADSGSVEVRGRQLARRPSHALARLGLARTFQATQLFNSLSVEQNVVLALESAGRRGSGTASGDIRRAPTGADIRRAPTGADIRRAPTGADIRRTAHDLLAFVGYRGDANVTAADLPFVDRRWVELARTLALQPETVLLDEPAAGLAHGDVVELTRLIRRIAGCGLKVLLVEHHMDLVMELSTRVLVLDAGRPLASGAPAQIQADPAVIAAYLGSDAAAAAPAPRGTARPPAAERLSVRGVVSGYGKVEVLHGIDLDVGAGELVALVGANGAGKSTLLRTLAGLVAARAGELRFDGTDLRGRAPEAIVRAGIVMVPEGRQVFPELSVLDNLRLGAYLRRGAEVQADVDALFVRFPRLRERSAQRAGLLSGGEQQMLALARGLIARPKLLLLDEPSLGLAPKFVAELYRIVAQLRDEGRTLLLVDQFARLALALADRAYVMATGRIVKHGPAAQLAADPAVEAAYLGKA